MQGQDFNSCGFTKSYTSENSKDSALVPGVTTLGIYGIVPANKTFLMSFSHSLDSDVKNIFENYYSRAGHKINVLDMGLLQGHPES